MTEFKAVWVSRTPGQPDKFESWPANDAGDVVVTNLPDAFEGILPGGAADVAALYALAFPETPSENLEHLLRNREGGAQELWRLWQESAASLAQLPLWALESIELLLRELTETALARVIAFFAAQRRHDGSGGGNWLDTFKFDGGWPEKRVLPEHEDCSPLDIAGVAAHIQPGGAFARLMPGYEVREGQVEMLVAVAQAFNTGKHLLVEAGTGVGKSLAYLLPAAAWALLNDMPVVISTNTRNLQSQLLEKDVPLARTALQEAGQKTTLRVALMKGRSNYLCLRRLSLLLEHSQFELERPEMRRFTDVIAWSTRTADGDLDAFAGTGHADPAFLSKLASSAEECPGRSCRYWRRCFLQKARARAMGAHLVIANHALVFSEAQAPGTTLPACAQIVFDEAHNLEEVATRHLSTEITPARLRQLLRRLSRGRGRRAGGALEVLRNHLEKGAVTASEECAKGLRRQIRLVRLGIEELPTLARELFSALQSLVPIGRDPVRFRCVPVADDAEDGSPAVILPLAPDAPPLTREVCRNSHFLPCAAPWDEAALSAAWQALRIKLLECVQELGKLAEMLREAGRDELLLYGDQAANIDGSAVALRTFLTDLDFMLTASDPQYVFWLEPVGRVSGAAELFAAPLSIGETLAELLYLNKASVILCSATLRVGSSFGFISRRLGIDRIPQERVMTCVAQSPFDYLTQCAALAPTFLPAPTGETGGAYVEQLSGLMLDVFTRTRGRAMGLFTSYEMMNQVARLLEEPLEEAGIRLLVQRASGTRDQITRVFRAGGACVLLGAQSFWEGVDVAGEALSCVVVARLPFGVVTDPINAARCEEIERRGGSAFRELSLPQAVIRFRQGFGRLIRTRADKGVVVVADPRVFTKNYGSTFRQSLPCPLLRIGALAELTRRVDELFKQ